MVLKEVKVPDIGGAADVDVIDVLVKTGDRVQKDDPIITLESEKASMDIPSPYDGVIKSLNVTVGNKVSQDDVILTVETESTTEQVTTQAKDKTEKEVEQAQMQSSFASDKDEQVTTSLETEKSQEVIVRVPDIGNVAEVDVIEVLVKVGDVVNKEDPLITMESEKASMDMPSPYAGEIKDIRVNIGDKIRQGDVVLILSTVGSVQEPLAHTEKVKEITPTSESKKETLETNRESKVLKSSANIGPLGLAELEVEVHAGPGVRRYARELGVDLQELKGTGHKNRILFEDVQKYIKELIKNKSVTVGPSISQQPEIDFAKFGEIEERPLNKIKRLTGNNVHRSWISVPHVTQFDEADITELEDFRQGQKTEADKREVKLTPLVFLMKASVACLKKFPQFNTSLNSTGEKLIYKKYYHIGVAVDTPDGLVVPVIRDVDKKGLFELAQELGKISSKAREKGLAINEMQGSCFTISSLGGIGGTGFTPIVNKPDVAILGVSKAQIKPVYINQQFVPRLMLPLSLSYDHRVIDGAEAARFTSYLATLLKDIRHLLL